jgi:hypothetical protein
MCGGDSTVGSNPTGTAIENPRSRGGFLFLRSVLGASLVHSCERTTPHRGCLLLGAVVSQRASDPVPQAHSLFLERAQHGEAQAFTSVSTNGPCHCVAPLKL